MTDETELRDLERRLAYSAALHIVDSQHWRILSDDKKWLSDTHAASSDMGTAIRYLDLRGLLERKPDAPHLVRIKETDDD